MDAKKRVEPDVVESRLARIFQPVHPSRKFIKKVRGRIYLAAPAVVVSERLDDAPRLFFVMSLALSIGVLALAGIRALFYLTHRVRPQ